MEKKSRALNRTTVPGKKARKRMRSAKNQEAARVMSLGTWLDDGGAIHPRDLED